MVQRITGQAHAEQVPLEVEVVLTDQALLGEDDEPAVVVGYGAVPAGAARDLVARAERVALRRLLTEPATGQLWRWSPARGTSRAGCALPPAAGPDVS